MKTREDQRKIDAYDAARAIVKTEGNSRAYYVLRAEAAEEENTRLYKIIDEKIESVGELVLVNTRLEADLERAEYFARERKKFSDSLTADRARLEAELDAANRAILDAIRERNVFEAEVARLEAENAAKTELVEALIAARDNEKANSRRFYIGQQEARMVVQEIAAVADDHPGSEVAQTIYGIAERFLAAALGLEGSERDKPGPKPDFDSLEDMMENQGRPALHTDREAAKTETGDECSHSSVAEDSDIPAVLQDPEFAEPFMQMVNEVSNASRGLPAHLSDAEREAQKCECGYPAKPCLRIMLRNGPPFPARPCEPLSAASVPVQPAPSESLTERLFERGGFHEGQTEPLAAGSALHTDREAPAKAETGDECKHSSAAEATPRSCTCSPGVTSASCPWHD